MPALPIHEVIIEDRQRKDYGDITALASSLQSYGLIQPIILTQDKKLVAGGRRLAAATSLGWTEIEFNYKEVLSQDQLHELELEENIRRKAMSWQEECRCIATIHRLKIKRNALDGKSWGIRATGELLGTGRASVHRALQLDAELVDPSSPLWKMERVTDALQELLNREIRAGEAELAMRHAARAASLKPEMPLGEVFMPASIESAPALPSPALKLAQERYLSNPLNDPNGFEAYWAEKYRLDANSRNSVHLSRRIKKQDAISFLHDMQGQFQHIITDPPYAIDMDMLDQDNSNQKDIDLVRHTHEIEPNKELLMDFLNVGYDTLPDTGYCIFWCDQEHWNWLHEVATEVGFAVQRWPFVWCKTTRGKNGAPQYNMTKMTEIAMVCRKGPCTLARQGPQNYVLASAIDDITSTCDHPFAKPYAVWEPLIEAVSIKGQTIIEPFAGSGTGVISALRLERNILACEKDDICFNHLLENVKAWYLSVLPQAIFI